MTVIRLLKMNQESDSQSHSIDEASLNDITNVRTDATAEDTQQSQVGTQQEISHVTYIIGQGKEIIMHRFELDLSPDQPVEMVIKARDTQTITRLFTFG